MIRPSSPLNERWRKESAFHDQMAEHDMRWTAFRSYGLSAASIRYAKALVGDVKGKVLVDCGCGNGEHTLTFIKPRAIALAFDLSHSMVKAAENRLAQAKNEVECMAFCQQMGAEQIAYRSESIDIVFGISILHHLNLSLAIQEIKRVLKPGGRAIFVEPLNHNPVAKFYRMLTQDHHSETERPLDYSILDFFKQQFGEVHHKEFYLLSLGATTFAYFRSKPLFDWSLAALSMIDEWLFARWPWLRRYAWITVVELIK
jgi:ubiquinone/menaquinone biosynthesis C-methylase UbiE